MPIFRWMVVLPDQLGDPKNTRVNTFHFSIPDPDLTDYQAIAGVLDECYDAASALFNENVDFALTQHKVYNLDDDVPRAPVYEELQTGMGTDPVGSGLPPEVALCLSFQGAKVSGQPQARRRGRVYLGPLAASINTSGVPSNASCLLVTGFGDALLAASDAAAGAWRWVVYSPTNGTAVNVVDGWCDNAFDIQRRRGFSSTTRFLFS